jgi:hypothetical protein
MLLVNASDAINRVDVDAGVQRGNGFCVKQAKQDD